MVSEVDAAHNQHDSIVVPIAARPGFTGHQAVNNKSVQATMLAKPGLGVLVCAVQVNPDHGLPWCPTLHHRPINGLTLSVAIEPISANKFRVPDHGLPVFQ